MFFENYIKIALKLISPTLKKEYIKVILLNLANVMLDILTLVTIYPLVSVLVEKDSSKIDIFFEKLILFFGLDLNNKTFYIFYFFIAVILVKNVILVIIKFKTVNTLEKVYKDAKFISSYSKDITQCINLAFKNCKTKILKTNISIDINKFNFKIKKTNTITYMPRKLPAHSDNLIFFLRNNLPKSWKIKALHNLNEKEVYNNLLKSKIFLSFSNMEGLGMPPIEAAMAGNKVIGYSGQGGKEYWQKPIFTEIPHGDLSLLTLLELLQNTGKYQFHLRSVRFDLRGKCAGSGRE